MNQIVIGLGTIIVLLLLFVLFGNIMIFDEGLPEEIINQETIMKITSSAFEHNQLMPQKFTCDGDDVNPPLQFSDVPEGTKSLTLVVDDPDAPVGLWVHWTVWNIKSDTTEIVENSVPSGGVEGVTSFGNVGYGGPCPPSGEHRYFFKLYALDTELDLSTESDKEDLEEAIVGHVLDKAELIGLYKR